MEITRRRALAWGACPVTFGVAGCSQGTNTLDITVINENTEAREAWVEIEQFEQELTLAPGDEETFEDALDYPDETTEATVTMEIDGTLTTTDFILSETLDELVIGIERPDAVSLTRVSEQ